MKQNNTSAPRFHSLRAGVQRFAFLALIVGAFGLMLLGKADTLVVERLRTSIADAVAPIMDVLSRPAVAVSRVFDHVHELAELRTENTRLRAENSRLLRWQAAARALESENQALRGLMNFSAGPAAHDVSARVIADTGGVFVHSLIVHAGTRDNVRKGSAVVSDKGLVGRVAEAGERSARVLLITDINSRIPVLIENTRMRAILAGDNSDQPRLIYLDDAARLAPGDRVVTSGHAGAFPPGIPVGVLANAGESVRVEPFVSRARLEYVRVVDYALPGILQPKPAADQARSGR